MPHPLEGASVAPPTAPPGTTATRLEPLDSLIPPVASLPENPAVSLDRRLSSLSNLDTPQKQGQFLLELLLELAPARSIFLHTIDPRSQEATVVGVHGEHASTLSEWTTEPQDPLLTQLRRLRRPLKITAPSADERCRKGRWAVALPQKYLVAIPVLHAHKLLGFIELADPLTGNRFEHDQLEAISEIANAWGSRLA